MKQKLTLVIFAVMALVAGGCRDWFPPIDPLDPKNPTDPKDPPTRTESFEHIRWCLESFSADNGLTFERVDPSLDIHLIFNGMGEISGFTGCNGLGGQYKHDPIGGMQIWDIITTEMYCDPGSEYENRFVEGLLSAHSYKVAPNGSAFHLYHDGGVMNFVPCGEVDPNDPRDPGDTCDPADPPVDPIEAPLYEEFKLPYGATAHVEGGVLVTFYDLIEESRCPEGADCFDAGNAKILVGAQLNNSLEQFELNTHREPRTGKIGDYTVRLVGLYPYPSLERNSVILIDEYVAVIEVSK